MKIYICKNLNGLGEGTVYVLESLFDWDRYEEILGGEKAILEHDRNFYEFKNDFKKYIGSLWKDRNNSDKSNIIYKVVGMEDNNPAMDWYWVLQNTQDDKDIIYLLANSWELQEGLI